MYWCLALAAPSYILCICAIAVPVLQDRLETLGHVRDAGISVCAGGIIGLGEGEKDRVGLLHQVPTVPAWL